MRATIWTASGVIATLLVTLGPMMGLPIIGVLSALLGLLLITLAAIGLLATPADPDPQRENDRRVHGLSYAAIGALLIVAPPIHAYFASLQEQISKANEQVAQQNKTLEDFNKRLTDASERTGEMSFRIPAGSPPGGGPTKPQQVPSFDVPTYRGLHFYSHTAVIDLRRCVPAPIAGEIRRDSPVTRLLTSCIDKGESTLKSVDFQFSTRGHSIDAFCFGSEEGDAWNQWKVEELNKRLLIDGLPMKVYQLSYGLGAHAPNERFTVSSEIIYWGAYYTGRHEWSVLVAPPYCDELNLIHIFSFTRPFTNPTVWAKKGDEEIRSGLPQPVVIKKDNYISLSWRIRRPRQGWSYRIEWDW